MATFTCGFFKKSPVFPIPQLKKRDREGKKGREEGGKEARSDRQVSHIGCGHCAVFFQETERNPFPQPTQNTKHIT